MLLKAIKDHVPKIHEIKDQKKVLTNEIRVCIRLISAFKQNPSFNISMRDDFYIHNTMTYVIHLVAIIYHICKSYLLYIKYNKM